MSEKDLLLFGPDKLAGLSRNGPLEAVVTYLARKEILDDTLAVKSCSFIMLQIQRNAK